MMMSDLVMELGGYVFGSLVCNDQYGGQQLEGLSLAEMILVRTRQL